MGESWCFEQCYDGPGGRPGQWRVSLDQVSNVSSHFFTHTDRIVSALLLLFAFLFTVSTGRPSKCALAHGSGIMPKPDWLRNRPDCSGQSSCFIELLGMTVAGIPARGLW